MKATARPGWDLGKARYLDLGITLAWRVVDVGDRDLARVEIGSPRNERHGLKKKEG